MKKNLTRSEQLKLFAVMQNNLMFLATSEPKNIIIIHHEQGYEVMFKKTTSFFEHNHFIFSPSCEFLGYMCACCELAWKAKGEDDYMLTNELWATIAKDELDILHWKCAQKIHGKPFTKHDLKLCLCEQNLRMIDLSKAQHKENQLSRFPESAELFERRWAETFPNGKEIK